MIANVSDLVKAIRTSDSKEDALNNYTGTLGFSDLWISSVYKSKKELPVLDTSFDVNMEGKDALTSYGISEDVQTAMWNVWSNLDDDIKAPWVIDWKKLDLNDGESVNAFLTVISNFLLTPS